VISVIFPAAGFGREKRRFGGDRMGPLFWWWGTPQNTETDGTCLETGSERNGFLDQRGVSES